MLMLRKKLTKKLVPRPKERERPKERKLWPLERKTTEKPKPLNN